MASGDVSLLAYFGACVTLNGGVWMLFDRLETTARPEFREDVAKWLRNVKVSNSNARWPAQFVTAFDRVFGRKHLSWKCFIRSCMMSLIAVFVMLLLWGGIRRNEFQMWIHGGEVGDYMLVIGASSMIVNFIPDYISLLETRILLGIMARVRTWWAIFCCLFLDLLFTACIPLSMFGLLAVLGGISPREFFRDNLGDIILLSTFEPGVPPAGILFYAAFATSVWTWLYALSGMIVKALQLLSGGINFVRGRLNVEEKPFQVMGYVAMLLVVLGFLAAFPFRFL
jgi:hypothetical protein